MSRIGFSVCLFWAQLLGLLVTSANGDDLALLEAKLKAARQAWPQGSMQCRVLSPFGSTTINATWSDETVRLDYAALKHELAAIPPKTDPAKLTVAMVSLRNQKWLMQCDLLEDLASIRPVAKNAMMVSPSLRVTPGEVWSEIAAGKTLSQWLTMVRSDSETEFSCQREADGGWTIKLRKPGNSFEAKFNALGLLTSAHTLSSENDRGTLHLDIDWDVSRTPAAPVRYVKRTGQSGTVLEIEVDSIQSSVGKVSLEFPPKDLPLGIRVSDERGPNPLISFTGGEVGRQLFAAKQSAEQLKQ